MNRKYCERHGYKFLADVLAYEDMLRAIAPKQHCTWYKVKMAIEIMKQTEMLRANDVRYVMWIDAGEFTHY